MKLQIPATIEKVATRVDNTISISLSTQELNPEGATALFSLKGKLGWMLFSESELDDKDIPEETLEFKDEKSPSKRLKSVLFVYWKQHNISQSFNNFYSSWIEKKIDEIKENLN